MNNVVFLSINDLVGFEAQPFKVIDDEAMQELKAMVADAETELKTRGITYGTDYRLGDIVRVQNNDTAVKKRITSVIMSQENGYIENPIFSAILGNG